MLSIKGKTARTPRLRTFGLCLRRNPLREGGICEAASILEVHPQSLFVTYLTFVLNDNPADLVDSTLTTFHCCKDIEDLIAPA